MPGLDEGQMCISYYKSQHHTALKRYGRIKLTFLIYEILRHEMVTLGNNLAHACAVLAFK